MLRLGSLVTALFILSACDTGSTGQVPATSSTGGQSGPGSSAGGSSGDDGDGNSAGGLGIPGVGGLGNGILGSDSDAGPGSTGNNGNGGTLHGGGSGGVSAGGDTARFLQYIQSAQYSKLVFEIDSVEGQEPRAAVQTQIPERFAALLDKPGGIEVVLDDTLPANGSDFVWSNEDLDQVTTLSFDGDPDPDTLAIHITYVDGHSGGDSDSGVILGVAWGWLQVVMYKETIENSCGGLGLLGGLREQACEAAEVGILTHEIGHVIGLVDNGLPMVDDHRDPVTEHGAHDKSQDCIMYWAYEGQGLIDLIGTRLLAGDDSTLPFCQHCLDDLNAVK